MGLFNLTDTICALSTPPGTGAIAVIRLSGPAAFDTVVKIFRPAEKNLDLSSESEFRQSSRNDDLF